MSKTDEELYPLGRTYLHKRVPPGTETSFSVKLILVCIAQFRSVLDLFSIATRENVGFLINQTGFKIYYPNYLSFILSRSISVSETLLHNIHTNIYFISSRASSRTPHLRMFFTFKAKHSSINAFLKRSNSHNP